MHREETSRRVSWPYGVEDKSYLMTWLFWVPLFAYTLWQVLYFLIVDVLRRQRLLRDPEVMTSYRFGVLFQHGYLRAFGLTICVGFYCAYNRNLFTL